MPRPCCAPLPSCSCQLDGDSRIDRHILPNWGNLKATALRRADVAALHVKIGTTARYEANRVVALVSKMFELARRWGFVPEDHPNPARGVDHFREEKHDRWITPEELPRLAQAGNTLHLIGRVLNHSNVSTTQVYARFGEDHVRAALEQHGARLMGAAGRAPAAEVVDISGSSSDRRGIGMTPPQDVSLDNIEHLLRAFETSAQSSPALGEAVG